MKALAVAAAAVLVLSAAAGPLKKTGVPALLAVLAVGGGVALVVRGLLAVRLPQGAISPKVRFLLSLVGGLATALFGAVLLVGGVLLAETYWATEGNRPLTRILAQAASPGPCTVPQGIVSVAIDQPEALREFGRRPELDTCKGRQQLPAVRIVGALDLRNLGDAELWASRVEIPAGSSITLGRNRLAIHAVDWVGEGRVVAWPREETAAGGQAPGEAGAKGANGGDLVLDLLGVIQGKPKVDLRGQVGGAGAKGATGIPGSRGSRGDDASSGLFDCQRGGGDGGRGGNGGQGGLGGPGGAGGDGGSLLMHRPERAEVLLAAVDFEPGRADGGPGGPPGEGGPGGPGGDGGGGKGFCGGGHGGPPGERGPDGDKGEAGARGASPQRAPASVGTVGPE